MADDYRQASLDIWERMAAGWEDDRGAVWDASRVVGEWLVDALDPQPGETLLEIAAGVGDTGLAAAARLGSSGKLISTDFSEPMVAAPRRRAEELRVANVEFRTMRETRRVLRPGGRVAFSVWVIRALPEADQAAVRRLTEEKLRPVVRTPGYNVAGLCLNVLAE